jgi:peroxiredoxin
MVLEEGDEAPSFKAQMVTDEIKSVELSDFFGDTLVLAFFPAAFSPVCKKEMCKLRDSMKDFEALETQVMAVSVDTPFSLKKFREENNLNFPLISDHNKEAIELYDVRTSFEDKDFDIAERAVFIIEDGEITYSQVTDTIRDLPDFRALNAALRE